MWQKWSNEILIIHLPETNLRPNIIHETTVLGTLAVRWQRLAIKWGEIQSVLMVLSGWSQAEARASLSCRDGAGSLEQLDLWVTQESKFRDLEVSCQALR